MHRSCLRYLCLILWLCSYAFAQELDELDRRLTHLEQMYASAHQQKGKDLVRRIHYEYEILYNLEVATL